MGTGHTPPEAHLEKDQPMTNFATQDHSPNQFLKMAPDQLSAENSWLELFPHLENTATQTHQADQFLKKFLYFNSINSQIQK